MASLIVPISVWLRRPTLRSISQAVFTDDGRWLVVVNGTASVWVCKVLELKDESYARLQLTPHVLLPTRSKTTCLAFSRIEVESLPSADNVVITGHEDSSVCMFDLSEGRCLQFHADAQVGRIITIIVLRKVLLVIGHTGRLAILGVERLQALQVAHPFKAGVSAVCVSGKGDQNVIIHAACFDQCLRTCVFEESSLTFKTASEIPLPGHYSPRASVPFLPFHVAVSPSKTYVMAISNACYIISTQGDHLTLVSQIHPADSAQRFKLGRFLSDTLLLLCTENAGFLYYLGTQKVEVVASVASVPDNATILFAKGTDVSYVPKTSQQDKIGNVTHCVARLVYERDSGPITTACALKQSESWHLLAFGADFVKCWNFAADVQKNKYMASTVVFHETVTDGIAPHAHHRDLDIATQELLPELPRILLSPTAITLIPHTSLAALGYENGDVRVVKLAAILTNPEDLDQETLWLLKGHGGSVTSLCAVKRDSHSADSADMVLLSAAKDCTMKIWSLRDGNLLASFTQHSLPVTLLLPIPPELQLYSKPTILSLAADNTLVFYDVSDLRMTYRLSGHTSTPTRLHYKSKDDMMIVETLDAYYCWDLKTAHLERVSGDDEILEAADSVVLLSTDADPSDQAVWGRSIYEELNHWVPPIAFTILINLKRVVNDLHGQQLVLETPSRPQTPSGTESTISSPVASTASSTKSLRSPLARNRDGSRSRRERSGSRSTHHFREFKELFKINQKPPPAPTIPVSLLGSQLIVSECPKELPRIDGIAAMALFNVFAQELRDTKANMNISCGTRCAWSMLSLLAPRDNPLPVWGVSGFISGGHLLAVSALGRALQDYPTCVGHMECPLLGACDADKLQQCIAKLQTQIHDRQDALAFPSFAFLAKYWEDAIEDIRLSAREAFEATLKVMTMSQKTQIVRYWAMYITDGSGTIGKMNMRAAVILGIVGCFHWECLESVADAPRQVARLLDRMLRDESTPIMYRTTAIDLLGRGFAGWEKFVDSGGIVKLLVMYSGVDGGQPDADDSAANKGASLVAVSRQSIVNIARASPELFIHSLLSLLTSGSIPSRTASLKILLMLVSKQPLLLYPHLAMIVASLVKCLDPNVPNVRDALQGLVTISIAEMVRVYPCVDFSRGPQRLSVAYSRGVEVWDCRIAGKLQTLEHPTSPLAIATSPDGRLLATYSADENVVRIFQPSTGLFNSLLPSTGHLKLFRSFTIGPAKAATPDSKRQTLSETALMAIRFRWNEDRRVTLTGNEVEFSFTV
ncbi:hypothetical protein BC832DRAFT_50955 [Gaertneriomyces semiglobifer]|nr:hypothetical protein BC832DRAFT_50955 [Gaertneriomyces semiglobifer]